VGEAFGGVEAKWDTLTQCHTNLMDGQRAKDIINTHNGWIVMWRYYVGVIQASQGKGSAMEWPWFLCWYVLVCGHTRLTMELQAHVCFWMDAT
jgi:hypothetical protein